MFALLVIYVMQFRCKVFDVWRCAILMTFMFLEFSFLAILGWEGFARLKNFGDQVIAVDKSVWQGREDLRLLKPPRLRQSSACVPLSGRRVLAPFVIRVQWN